MGLLIRHLERCYIEGRKEHGTKQEEHLQENKER
jgi:hypothetical protein